MNLAEEVLDLIETSLILKQNKHVITDIDKIELTPWDKEVKGYAGVVQYSKNGKSYLPYVTKKEIDKIKQMKNVKINKTIVALKYTGTY